MMAAVPVRMRKPPHGMSAKPSWESPVHHRLDDVRSKKSEGKTHARRSFADAFAGGDRLDANLVGNHLIEPSSALGDSA